LETFKGYVGIVGVLIAVDYGPLVAQQFDRFCVLDLAASVRIPGSG
jgi:hypothetical protein